uniref:Uncharacterized protein n=1 Tax=Guillardia theta TaxID=55529 RepID=A0A7S4KD80_GUITH|mmetsp:Transcript_22941/g.74810  ORF Transcript_22941/g.74810 Transcript_22941/m.74810 type:complete len:325 (+) Transcript_22941:119-1093(+)
MSGSSAKRLHEVAKLGKLDEVREALKQEAVTSRDQWGETPLHWASSPAVAKALLDAMADVNSVDPTGDLPLHWASEHGQVEVMKVLLQNAANVNARNQRGETALHAAASSQSWSAVKLLIENKADVLAANVRGESALNFSVRSGDLNSAKALIKAGSRVRDACADGTTVLHDATLHGPAQLVKLLTQCKADVNATTASGKSVLDFALRRKNQEILDELAEQGLDLNFLAKAAQARGEGWTPLHIAAEAGSYKLCQAAIKKGIKFQDPEARNSQKQTAADVARQSPFAKDSLVKYLEDEIQVKRRSQGRNKKGEHRQDLEGSAPV